MMKPIDTQEGHTHAVRILRACVTPTGFIASPTDKDNYARIWARDSAVMSLAAYASGEDDLIEAAKNSLLTLARHQGAHGEIPSNVAVDESSVSFGQTTGRVDATLWFVIACAQHYKHTNDHTFLENVFPHIERCISLLGAWEFNLKGFIYVPPTGDWADEYIREGYVLYDQVLYFRALKEYHSLLLERNEKPERAAPIGEKVISLEELIRTNFWIWEMDENHHAPYHPVLYEHGRKHTENTPAAYWMPHFSPRGYGFLFDAFANVLVSLFGIATDHERKIVDHYIEDRFSASTQFLLPAFYPVIHPGQPAWDDLEVAYSHSFKNKPFEYHNGGLWPMITGFYVLDLALRGKNILAEQYTQGIFSAGELSNDPETQWGFHEYLHGKTFRPSGVKQQGWSAAASIIAHKALDDPKGIFL